MRLSHDGYRLIARRDGNRVRLYTRRGYDWSRWHATYNPSVDDRWISAARGDMSYELQRQNGSVRKLDHEGRYPLKRTLRQARGMERSRYSCFNRRGLGTTEEVLQHVLIIACTT
jgi:hypothetical protein